MTIVDQMQATVKEGKTIEEAIDQIIPGADPVYWERILANRSNITRPQRQRRQRTTTSRFASCNLPANANIIGKLNGDNGGSTPAPVTPLTIWDRVQRKIKAQDINLAPGASEIIWEGKQKHVSLRRDTGQEEIRLVAKIGNRPSILSPPVIRWGRDHTYRNGTRGIWKLTLSAEHNYAQWQNEVRGDA